MPLLSVGSFMCVLSSCTQPCLERAALFEFCLCFSHHNICFLPLLIFFSPRLTVLFTFRSETSIHFGLGTTVFYFLPCCHVTDFTEAFSVCYCGGFILINTVWF